MPGETPLVGHSFMYSTIAFYLHMDIELTNRRLYAARPNTLLGLIPAGTARSNFPIENIAGGGAVTRFNLFGFLVGALALLVGLAGLSSPTNAPLGVLLLVIGVLLILASPKQAIEVLNSGGGAIGFPVSVLERSRTVEFANRVSEAVARTTTRPAAPSAQPAPTLPNSDPSEALHRLNQLREQGLVSEDEYAAKRGDLGPPLAILLREGRQVVGQDVRHAQKPSWPEAASNSATGTGSS